MPVMNVVVQGRVQGVGFRAHVARAAVMAGITGEVWNRRDGAVEVVAFHDDPATLEEFADRLRHGPGWVDHVWTDFIQLGPPPPEFTIGPTR
jgi:acylphosphatase